MAALCTMVATKSCCAGEKSSRGFNCFKESQRANGILQGNSSATQKKPWSRATMHRYAFKAPPFSFNTHEPNHARFDGAPAEENPRRHPLFSLQATTSDVPIIINT